MPPPLPCLPSPAATTSGGTVLMRGATELRAAVLAQRAIPSPPPRANTSVSIPSPGGVTPEASAHMMPTKRTKTDPLLVAGVIVALGTAVYLALAAKLGEPKASALADEARQTSTLSFSAQAPSALPLAPTVIAPPAKSFSATPRAAGR